MTVNGRRKFVSNTGKRYFVCDMCKQDIRGEEKYNLEVEKDRKSRLCYGPFLELLKFKTIKEAQRYVLYNEIAIETMW